MLTVVYPPTTDVRCLDCMTFERCSTFGVESYSRNKKINDMSRDHTITFHNRNKVLASSVGSIPNMGDVQGQAIGR